VEDFGPCFRACLGHLARTPGGIKLVGIRQARLRLACEHFVAVENGFQRANASEFGGQFGDPAEAVVGDSFGSNQTIVFVVFVFLAGPVDFVSQAPPAPGARVFSFVRLESASNEYWRVVQPPPFGVSLTQVNRPAPS
jgi:hypothetical protein